MKKYLFGILSACFAIHLQAQDADSTGLAGDHFSLQGALDLFKNADSPEAFEKALNTESNYVNNLDLNNDGEIDYVKVVNLRDGDSHVFVLQVAVNERENQDVAVIELEKNGAESAQVQIVGDEELYGKDVLAEPQDEVAKGGKSGPDAAMETHFIIVNVWGWPCVRYVYAPSYVLWVSPWRWHYYPTWWRPWRPFGWRTHWNHCHHFHTHYVIVHQHRNMRANRVYQGHRSVSPVVQGRYKAAHEEHNKRKKDISSEKSQPNKSNEGKLDHSSKQTGRSNEVGSKKPAESKPADSRGKNESKPNTATKPSKGRSDGKPSKGNSAKPAKGGTAKPGRASGGKAAPGGKSGGGRRK